MSTITTKDVKIRITKNVFWDDWGTMRLAFQTGWEGWATAYYNDRKLFSVCGESPRHMGVVDEIWDGHYEILEG